MATHCPLAWTKDALGNYWLIDGGGRELATICSHEGGRFAVSLCQPIGHADSIEQAKSMAEHEAKAALGRT